jgi:hypothetical protein
MTEKFIWGWVVVARSEQRRIKGSREKRGERLRAPPLFFFVPRFDKEVGMQKSRLRRRCGI